MTRLDGEKKSPLPWIIGLIVLALIAAGIYYFVVANKGVDSAIVAPGEVELLNTAPGGLGVDDDVVENTALPNATDMNMTDANANANAMDANSTTMGGTDTNMADANMTEPNAVNPNMTDPNAVNPNTMDANSAMMDNSVPVPGMTPALTNPRSNDTMGTR